MSTRGNQQLPLLPVLMATYRTQGQRTTDFAFAGDGELVTLDTACDRDRGNPDDSCACCRAFTGLRTRKATTTAVIVAMVLTRDDYLQRMRDSAIDAGFLRPGEDATDIDEQAEDLLRIAAEWPIGTVVQRRGDVIQVRQWPPEPRA